MVENSLGRLYAQSQKTMDEKTVADSMDWKYYLPQAEQTEEVQKKLDEIKSDFNLETVKVLDPCMGSGHILVYAFDVLVKIYQNAGYNERDAAKLILENNIYGLDIDDRAAQLAYFALMMKGRQYDRRFFDRGVSPKVYAIQGSNEIDRELLKRNLKGTVADSVVEALETTLNTFNDAKEYGSILDVEKIDYDGIIEGLENWKKNKENDLESVVVEECIDDELMPLIAQAKVMSDKFDVVVTNPPYMSTSGMPGKLSNYVKNNYFSNKSDLFACFIKKCKLLTRDHGYVGLLTPYVWLFIQSYEHMRDFICNNATITNLILFEYSAFEEATVPICTFVIQNQILQEYEGNYLRLTDFKGGMKIQEEKVLEACNNLEECPFYYHRSQNIYDKIPYKPIAFWISEKTFSTFGIKKIGDIAVAKAGIVTGSDKDFLKLWFEINYLEISFNENNYSTTSKIKYAPMNKGGDYRKYYGNYDYVINLRNLWDEKKKNPSIRRGDVDSYFKEGITWSLITSNKASYRYSNNKIFGVAAPAIFPKQNIYEILGLLNSNVIEYYNTFLNPTLNITTGNVVILPYLEFKKDVATIVKESIIISINDWNSFETSWDFTKHPLLPINIDYKDATSNSILISDCYSKWKTECSERFAKLKSNEEELNRIFIEIYALQDELTPEVLDKDVTVRLADRTRDVKSFISYAVGCMFGRYSLSKEGLAYAGGNMDMNNYKYFIPDADNVIPVTDEAYFNDDIVTRFVEFVRQVYGESTLDKNLTFIAESLGNKGDTPKEIIRSYFLNDFYKDHCKIYQKHPIYWMFDSGKENGFKALIYMHRYDNQTLARVRTDYLHKLQTMYEAALVQCKQIIENPVSSAHDKSNNIKRQTKITKQLAETRIYDQALGHIASQYIDIDLDDGVNVNYEKFQGVEVAREGQKALKVDLLGKRG